MDPAEELRLRTLAEIVGRDAVEEFACYDQVDIDRLVATLRIVAVGSIAPTLREVRKLMDIPLSAAKDALTSQGVLCTIQLAECAGSLESRRAIVTLENLKKAVEQHGGSAAIGLAAQGGDLVRADCSGRELNYVKTRIITWM